jgi:hypothetical protein
MAIAVGALAEPEKPQPTRAIGPVRKYSAAVSSADAERNKSVDRARTQLVVELKAAQRASLEANDIDGATTIAELVKENSSGSPAAHKTDDSHDAREIFRKSLIGVTFDLGTGGRITFLPDGKTTRSDPQVNSTWVVVGDRTVTIFSNTDYVDVWRFDGAGGFKAIAYQKLRDYEGHAIR